MPSPSSSLFAMISIVMIKMAILTQIVAQSWVAGSNSIRIIIITFIIIIIFSSLFFSLMLIDDHWSRKKKVESLTEKQKIIFLLFFTQIVWKQNDFRQKKNVQFFFRCINQDRFGYLKIIKKKKWFMVFFWWFSLLAQGYCLFFPPPDSDISFQHFFEIFFGSN